MKRCAAAAAVWLFAVGAADAKIKFLAFGDSITRSDGCPVDCDAEFDEQGLDGYVGRLETRLGGSYEVVNHGIGGEGTGEGLSRIDGVLNTGGDVLLLMEGTNDVSAGFSAESIAANLGAMVDKATAKGIDAVLASVIRRMNLPGHGLTQELQSETSSLANQKDRDFVNPNGPLCPTQSCFDLHYYQLDQEIGHVDASGYEIMTDLFEAVIRADSKPAKPTTIAPQGEIEIETPTYEWDHVSNANWYQVQVEDDNGSVLDEFVDASKACSGSVCTFAPGDVLPEAAYEWRVRARNLIDYSVWSNWVSFTVATTRPGTVVLISPSGDFFSASPLGFLFEWNEAPDTDEYELQVLDAGGVRVIKEFYPTSVCGGPSCDAMPAGTLGGGEYTWRVRGLNGVGEGPWSAVLPIVIFSEAPDRVPLIFPDGDTYQAEPTYMWKEVAGATGYELEVEQLGGVGTILVRNYGSDKCAAGICKVTPTVALDVGSTFKWRMRAANPLGDGLWTGFTKFQVLECSDPKDLTVSNESISGVETFTTCGTLTVKNSVEILAGGSATFHAGGDVILEDGVEVDEAGELVIRVDF